MRMKQNNEWIWEDTGFGKSMESICENEKLTRCTC